jgi:hypothetical protein
MLETPHIFMLGFASGVMWTIFMFWIGRRI